MPQPASKEERCGSVEEQQKAPAFYLSLQSRLGDQARRLEGTRTNILAVEVQPGTATAIRLSLAQLGIREPVGIRILWTESHSHGLLYRMKLHQPLHPTVISKLGQEAGGTRWWYHQEGQLNAYIPETEPKAPADLLWGGLFEYDPAATLTIEPVREELLNPLAYEVLIQDQPSGDIDDNAECVALLIEKFQEWQRDLPLVRGRFLEGVRRFSELWSKKTGHPVTQQSLIEHQALLGFTVCSTVSPQEKENGYTSLSFRSNTSLTWCLSSTSSGMGKEDGFGVCMQCWASLRNIRVPE